MGFNSGFKGLKVYGYRNSEKVIYQTARCHSPATGNINVHFRKHLIFHIIRNNQQNYFDTACTCATYFRYALVKEQNKLDPPNDTRLCVFYLLLVWFNRGLHIDLLRDGRSGARIPLRRDIFLFSTPIHTCPGAHPITSKTNTGLFTGDTVAGG